MEWFPEKKVLFIEALEENKNFIDIDLINYIDLNLKLSKSNSPDILSIWLPFCIT